MEQDENNVGKYLTSFEVKLKSSWEQQKKLSSLKTLILENDTPNDISDIAEIYSSKYMCDIKNINNPKYKGIYKWWLRLKEKYNL